MKKVIKYGIFSMLAFAIVCVSLSSCKQKKDNSNSTGTIKLEGSKYGDSELTIEFKAGGKCSMTGKDNDGEAVVTNGTYKVEGNKVTITYKQDGKDVSIEGTIEDGDKKIVFGEGEKKVELTKI